MIFFTMKMKFDFHNSLIVCLGELNHRDWMNWIIFIQLYVLNGIAIWWYRKWTVILGIDIDNMKNIEFTLYFMCFMFITGKIIKKTKWIWAWSAHWIGWYRKYYIKCELSSNGTIIVGNTLISTVHWYYNIIYNFRMQSYYVIKIQKLLDNRVEGNNDLMTLVMRNHCSVHSITRLTMNERN